MRKLVTFVAAVLVAGSALGQSFTDIDSPQYEGKTADKARNAAIDANFAEIEDGPTLESTVSKTDSWGISASHASATGVYATVELLDSSAAQTDTDYVDVELFEGVNDSAEATVWGVLRTIVDDNTTNTEDSAVQVIIPVAGTPTAQLEIDASGAIVNGAVDADNLTVDAGAGLDNQAAGTLLLGAATATKVEIGDSGVETEIQGPIDLQGTITATDTTAAGAVTPAATNAPALVSTTDAAYINVTISGEVYVIPVYQLDD